MLDLRGNRGAGLRGGLTLVEVLVVIVIVGVVIAMLLPATRMSRETGRRASCMNKTKELGLAFQNYASTFSTAFPPSAKTYPVSPTENAVGGYSTLVSILPNIEEAPLYNMLPKDIPNGHIDAAASANSALASALNTSLKEFICPSNNNNLFKDPDANPPRFALTNYKAIGALSRSSLIMAANPAAAPPYGTAKMHPDGALYPSDKNLPMSNIKDGTSHTVILMETIDDTNSRWLVGAECTMVGLPQASSPTGKTPTAPYAFFAPPGFDNTYGESSGVARAGLRTFLACDFSPQGADAGKYEDPGWAKAPSAYGPSSAHPGVINAAMADGSVQSISKRIDAANLFFLITKDNNDPFHLP